MSCVLRLWLLICCELSSRPSLNRYHRPTVDDGGSSDDQLSEEDLEVMRENLGEEVSRKLLARRKVCCRGYARRRS